MTVKRLFGTDGIRGNVSSSAILPENMTRLGRILGFITKTRSTHASTCAVTIGRDTRASSTYLEHALIAGITSMGVDVLSVGVMPTSGVAHCTTTFKTPFGVMISASHNPYYDNGVKLFDELGYKINAAMEQEIERYYVGDETLCEKISHQPGKMEIRSDGKAHYETMLTKNMPHSLNGIRLVVDCAHGAASTIAQELFAKLGANAVIIGASPTGLNINRDFGSEAPHTLQREVRAQNAALGIAFDGDADRVIFVDERGELIDGDAILAIMAIDQQQQYGLKHNVMVSTVMSSVALDMALAPHNISVVRTQVGDKYVARMMQEHDYSFGGENSGHVILSPDTTTGDGLFAALRFLSILTRAHTHASVMMSFFKPTPKLLKNIEVSTKIPLSEMPNTTRKIAQANESLLTSGRVMFRYSGTENKARLLVEAKTTSDCEKIADDIAMIFMQELAQKSA